MKIQLRTSKIRINLRPAELRAIRKAARGMPVARYVRSNIFAKVAKSSRARSASAITALIFKLDRLSASDLLVVDAIVDRQLEKRSATTTATTAPKET